MELHAHVLQPTNHPTHCLCGHGINRHEESPIGLGCPCKACDCTEWRTATLRTDQEIESLKDSWKNDPCWDIETTDGFEAYRIPLQAWRKKYVADLEDSQQADLEREAIKLGLNVADTHALRSARRRVAKETEAAVIQLRRLFNSVGLLYEDLDADLGQFVSHTIDAAVATMNVALLERNAKK